MNTKMLSTGLIITLALLPVLWVAIHYRGLEVVEGLVEGGFAVPQISGDSLYAALASPGAPEYLLFDVRTETEYRVSHLPSAIRVDPEMSGEEFLKQFGDSLSGKRVVFYCSVGVRSSALLSRVLKASGEPSPFSAANLRGGIFRWFNRGYPLVNAAGPTDTVHPYNFWWKQLIRKP